MQGTEVDSKDRIGVRMHVYMYVHVCQCGLHVHMYVVHIVCDVCGLHVHMYVVHIVCDVCVLHMYGRGTCVDILILHVQCVWAHV